VTESVASTSIGRQRSVDQLSAVDDAVVFNADLSRHAVAELPRVGDLVDASRVVVAAEQERGVVVGAVSTPWGLEAETALPRVKPANWMKP
jgi:hypothetical protein